MEPLISDLVSCANRFHAEIIDRSMRLAGEFVGRSNLTPAELAQAVRPIFENLTIEFLAPLMTQRYPQPEGHRAVAQYTQVFHQRLEGALRDMQIGFIGGRNVAGQLEQTIQANAFELLKAIERTTRGSAEPAHLEELHNLHITDGDAQAAFHYLSDKGLIAGHFGIPFAGRMTAAGHDAIKEAESIPDKASPALAAPIRRGGHREQTGKLAGGTRCRGSTSMIWLR